MANLNELRPIQALSPFKRFCCTIGNLPSSYVESMSYMELIYWLCDYLQNTVIPTIDNNAQAVKELQDLFIELQNYVNNYLNNLDLQEDINNKLDEMVQDGTLAEIVNQEIFTELNTKIDNVKNVLTNTANVHFIASENIIENSNFVGDCILITGEKNVLIDIGNQTNASVLIDYLETNNINKLDYIIITHYHDDHIGGGNAQGLLTLISQSFIDFSNCVVILPHKNINYSRFLPISDTNTYQTREQTIIQMLTNNDIDYTFATEGQEISLAENEKLSFFNVDTSYYDDYYDYTLNAFGEDTEATNYNNFSLITIYEHFNNTFVFTGDIEKLAQSKNYQNIKNCDVLKIEHHGLNWESDYNYLNQLNPKLAVVCNSQYYNTPFDYAHPTVFEVTSKGAKLYSTRTSQKTIVITSKFNKIFANCDNVNELHNMQYNLWSGQEILQGDDLNDEKYMKPRNIFL